MVQQPIAPVSGTQYQLPGGIRVTADVGTDATVITQPQLLSLDAGRRTPTYSVFLKSGKVDVDIPASAQGAVAVAAPADVRVICTKGASTVAAANRTVLAWSEKFPLLVSQKERLSKLAPGIVRRFAQGIKPEDHKALEAPKWQSGRHLWLAVPDKVKVSDFSWSPVPGAQTYRVELRKTSDDALIASVIQSQARVEGALPDLVAGDYRLLVRAVDRDGIPGSISAPLVLKVVGVAVPAGAKLQPDARIEMQRSQTVQLTNADGLSLKRATERKARPASEPVGIANGQATPLMIHDRDTTNACLMWLLPSQSPVVAYVGPKWAIWPHEALNLRVQWVDRTGH